jgi:hypothetical protein
LYFDPILEDGAVCEGDGEEKVLGAGSVVRSIFHYASSSITTPLWDV